jgi:hypothetical protein
MLWSDEDVSEYLFLEPTVYSGTEFLGLFTISHDLEPRVIIFYWNIAHGKSSSINIDSLGQGTPQIQTRENQLAVNLSTFTRIVILGGAPKRAFLRRWVYTGTRQKRRECNTKCYGRRPSHIELFSVSQATFEALLAFVPISRMNCISIRGDIICGSERVLTCNPLLWVPQLRKAQSGQDVNAGASHACVPLLFRPSRHCNRVSRKKEDQHSVQIQSSLDHRAYSSRLQANISCTSLDQSPSRARSLSGFSTGLDDRFLATRNSRSRCFLRSSQSNSRVIGDQVLCSTRRNTHSFRCISWGAVVHRLRRGF